MRTRAENLSILRNASGERIRTRDESLRIIQNFPVILRSEATKNPENRTPAAENYGTLSPNDAGAALGGGAQNGALSAGGALFPAKNSVEKFPFLDIF